jgi:hypothetical protein
LKGGCFSVWTIEPYSIAGEIGPDTACYRLPLNFDSYFKATLNKPGLNTFGNFRVSLDENGQALATFTIPPLTDPAFAGVVMHDAYLAASVLGSAEFASNAVPVTLVLEQPES